MTVHIAQPTMIGFGDVRDPAYAKKRKPRILTGFFGNRVLFLMELLCRQFMSLELLMITFVTIMEGLTEKRTTQIKAKLKE